MTVQATQHLDYDICNNFILYMLLKKVKIVMLYK
jgi:hypothetical protein